MAVLTVEKLIKIYLVIGKCLSGCLNLPARWFLCEFVKISAFIKVLKVVPGGPWREAHFFRYCLLFRETVPAGWLSWGGCLLPRRILKVSLFLGTDMVEGENQFLKLSSMIFPNK